VTYREAAAKLRRLGCEEVRRRGSHRRWVNPATGGRHTLSPALSAEMMQNAARVSLSSCV
jgi:predicted RNA binding protein YcfA (HicA-like mRNA interferase family)